MTISTILMKKLSILTVIILLFSIGYIFTKNKSIQPIKKREVKKEIQIQDCEIYKSIYEQDKCYHDLTLEILVYSGNNNCEWIRNEKFKDEKVISICNSFYYQSLNKKNICWGIHDNVIYNNCLNLNYHDHPDSIGIDARIEKI